MDRELVKGMIENAGIDCDITAVETRDAFVSKLRGENWDVILSDYSLPAFDGLQALEIAAKTCLETPFIFVTGTLGEDTVVGTIHSSGLPQVESKHSQTLSGLYV